MKFLDPQNKIKLFIDMEVTQQEASFITGIGALSFCSCYCDSLWDAWPPPPDDNDSLFNIPGTATLHFMSSGGDNYNPDLPATPQNGVLGIRSIEGGIERETEFNVSLKFIVTD